MKKKYITDLEKKNKFQNLTVPFTLHLIDIFLQ